MTGDELAAAAGTDPRFTTEWLRAMASARVITYTATERYSMNEEQRVALGSPGALGDLRPLFGISAGLCAEKNAGYVERALRTGVGASYDEQGERVARSIDGHHTPWMREKLVPFMREHCPTAVAALEQGGSGADVGCGAAASLVALAQAFPKATFHGYESSKEALAQAAAKIAAAGVGDRVTMHDFGAGARLPTSPELDFCFSHDVLHDVCDPVGVTRAVHAALKPSGMYLAGEPNAVASHDQTIRTEPGAATRYAFSVALCLQSATCEPGGPALGTCGFTEDIGKDVFAKGGFARCDAVMDGPNGNRFFRAFMS